MLYVVTQDCACWKESDRRVSKINKGKEGIVIQCLLWQQDITPLDSRMSTLARLHTISLYLIFHLNNSINWSRLCTDTRMCHGLLTISNRSSVSPGDDGFAHFKFAHILNIWPVLYDPMSLCLGPSGSGLGHRSSKRPHTLHRLQLIQPSLQR